METMTEDRIMLIQRATEDLLEDVGFSVTHRGIRCLARKAGAHVDEAHERIRIPGNLLRQLLAEVPSEYRITGISGNPVTIGGRSRHSLAIVTDPWILDYKTRSLCRPRLEDVRHHTIIAQKLDHIVSISRMDFPVGDIEGPSSSLRALEEHLMYHSKHYMVMPADMEGFRRWLEIGRIVLDGADLKGSGLISLGVAVVSPLELNELNAELLIGACEHSFPVVPTICPMAGATSPYSRASTLLQGNAECIFVAAIAQILNPGNPVLYTFGPSVTDMRTGYNRYYTLDKVLWKHAGVQMGHSYHMPAAAECGGTMTCRYDVQSGAEGMLFMKAAYDSGADLLSGFGSCCNAVGMSPEMMLIQTAWLEAAQYLERGIDFSAPLPGLENIKRAGPRGNFLTDDLTLLNVRSGEFFSHELFDYSGCAGEGSSMLERVHEMVGDMVSDAVSPLPGTVQEKLRRYFRDECRNSGT